MHEFCTSFCATFPREIRDLVYLHVLPETLNDRYAKDCMPVLWAKLSSDLRANFRRCIQDAAFNQMLFELGQMFLKRLQHLFGKHSTLKHQQFFRDQFLYADVAPCPDIRQIVLELDSDSEGFRDYRRGPMCYALDALAACTFGRCELLINITNTKCSYISYQESLYQGLWAALWELRGRGLSITMAFGTLTFKVSATFAEKEKADSKNWDMFGCRLDDWLIVSKILNLKIHGLIPS